MGGPARAHVFRDQLPQPRRVDARPHVRGLSDERPRDAVGVVREITGAPQVNTLVGLSRRHAHGDRRSPTTPRSVTTPSTRATFLNTHTDFSEPGALGVFTDEASVAGLERRMAKKGYLDASQMAHTFDAIRANDLVFQIRREQLAHGRKTAGFRPARVEQRQHTDAGHDALDLSAHVLSPQRVQPGPVGGRRHHARSGTIRRRLRALRVDDHIVPWTSAYRTARLLGGDNRFVSSTSGHIAGIVNPPSPKAKHGTNPEFPADPQEWFEQAELKQATWWQDWATWMTRRSGRKVAAPPLAG